jgi:hypothetical protein
LWPVTERRRTHETLPEFTTATWHCRACGWGSDGDPQDNGQDDGPDDGQADQQDGPPAAD